MLETTKVLLEEKKPRADEPDSDRSIRLFPEGEKKNGLNGKVSRSSTDVSILSFFSFFFLIRSREKQKQSFREKEMKV